MKNDTFALFAEGKLSVAGKNIEFGPLPWNEHPKFGGVYLKNIVGEEKTNGLFTCHLVRIAPGRAIGMHAHTDSIELHEVIGGSGTCKVGGRNVLYRPGVMAVLPVNSPHEVTAGEEGLCLFAKFVKVPV